MRPSRTLFFVFLFVSCATLFAQFRAGVQGSVVDSSGGAIPAATLTLTSSETRRQQTTTSNADGFYTFTGLAPGRYTLIAERAAFQKVTVENVAVSAETMLGVNVTLPPGEVTQAITVTSDSTPDLQTETADVSRSISNREIKGLPQIGRDPYELLRLTPGIFGDGARSGAGLSSGLPNTTGPGGSNSSIFQTENQVPISANGQRVSENNFEIDGVSVNSLGYGGAAVVTPNQESIKEIKVSSNAYSSEYGRNSGAQIEVVSQNGTDRFHGSGFFKYNSPKLNAYNRYGGVNAPPVRVNNNLRQFGGSLGGPILKDKLFFFASYEGLRNNSNDSVNAFIETPQYRQAVLSARPDGVTAKVFNSPGIMPRILSVLTVPCPSAFNSTQCQQVSGGLDIGSITGARGKYTGTSGGGLDGVPDIQYAQLALPNRSHGDQYNGRLDYTHGNDSVAISTYFSHRDDLGSDAGGRSRPMADLTNKPLNSAATITYNHIFSPTVFNEIRFNATRFSFNQVSASSNTNFGIPRIEVEGLPFDRIRFGAQQGETTPGIFAQNTFEFRDNLTKILGNHSLKFGLEYRKEQDNNNLVGGARPIYSFVGLFNLANDTPVYEGINASPITGAPADAQRYFRTSDWAEYVQDDWKASPNLTFNIGLRWELFTPLTEKQNRITNLVFGPHGLIDSRLVPVKKLFNSDGNNVAPRFGFAYNPDFLSKKLVVRGGFGIYFNRIPNVLFSNTRGNPPLFARYGLCCGFPDSPYANGQILYTLGSSKSPFSYPVNPGLATGIDPKTGGPLNRTVEIWGAPQHLPNGYAYIYSFGFEYSLPAKLVAGVGFQGSTDHKLIRLVNQNFLYPNNPAFGPVFFPQPDVNSNFNALNVRLSRQFAQGIQFQANYTWSKSIDTLSYGGPGAETNQTYPQDLKSERGPSDFDATHNFNFSAIWDLPIFRSRQGIAGALLGGWEINPIVTAHTGFPWTPKSGQSVSTPGGPSIGPTRPIAYFGGALHDTSNDEFIRPGGNFPGGGAKYFDFTKAGPPGIGRNVFRGPRYFSTDLSLVKQTRLSSFHLGEAANLELRANLYNAFNKLNLSPFRFFSPGTFADNNTFFGRADTALAGRVVELQARFSF